MSLLQYYGLTFGHWEVARIAPGNGAPNELRKLLMVPSADSRSDNANHQGALSHANRAAVR